MTEFNLRDAQHEDYPAIADLTTKAFGRPDEAAVIAKLRADDDVMLELVADNEGQIIGHALFYTMRVLGRLGALGLGPMSIDPWIQREGVGRGLLNSALPYLQEKGVPVVFVLGHPEYYPKFGFKPETTDDFEHPFKGNPAFMALRLRHGPPMSGKLIFPDAFGIAG